MNDQDIENYESLAVSLADHRAMWNESIKKSIHRKEGDAVIQALNEAGMGGINLAAKLLKITPQDLKRIITEHGIKPTWGRSGKQS